MISMQKRREARNKMYRLLRSCGSEVVEKVLATLAPREEIVISFRAGLNMGGIHTLQKAGERLGVSRERIRQIEAKALRKLHHPKRMERLNESASYQFPNKT